MLYLIGSAHSHIEPSKKSLRTIYEKVKPNIILSETSEEEALVFESNVPRLIKALKPHYPNPERISEIVELLRERYLGFEYCFNRAYAQHPITTHVCFDKLDGFHALKIRSNIDDQIAMLTRGEIALVEESLRYKKRKETPITEVRKSWKKYEAIEGTETLDKELLQDPEEFKRDMVMEEHIRKHHSKDKTLVAIVGAVHTLESPSSLTLYSKVQDLKPRRIYLFKPLAQQLK